MRHLKPLAVTVGALVAAAIVAVSAAATTDNRANSGAYSGTAVSGTVVKLGPSNLGQILVDAHGQTFYLWAHDTTATSTCNGACAQGLAAAPHPRNAVGWCRRPHHTARDEPAQRRPPPGHLRRPPLYYFANDTKPGQTNGEGLTGFGGRWDPVSAAGSAVRNPSDSPSDSYAPSYAYTYGASPLRATVSSPRSGDRAGAGGTTPWLSARARTS